MIFYPIIDAKFSQFSRLANGGIGLYARRGGALVLCFPGGSKRLPYRRQCLLEIWQSSGTTTWRNIAALSLERKSGS